VTNELVTPPVDVPEGEDPAEVEAVVDPEAPTG